MRRAIVWAVIAAMCRLYYRGLYKGDQRTLGWFLFIVWNFAALVGFGLCAIGSWIGAPLLAGGVLLGYPWLFTRGLLIPAGLWWPALFLGRAAHLAWVSPGGGAVAGALALLHRRRPSARGVDRVDAEIRRGELTAPKIVAAALLAERRGDRQTAVRLMRSLELLDDRLDPRSHQLARDFLIADAAESGRWRRVRELADAPLPTSRLGRFCGLVAARIIDGPGAVSNRALWLGWLTARRRRRSWSLLRRALDRTGAEPTRADSWPEPRELAIADTSDPLARALGAHVQLLAAPFVEIDDLITLGKLWDSAIESGALRERTLARAADLQTDGGERAADTFAVEIEREIAALVRGSGVCMELIPTRSAILARAVAAVRGEMLAELELAFAALEVRTDTGRALDAIDEWREMLALRELHAEAARLGGLPLRQIAFPQMHTPACNFAVWLWNERREYLVAETIFRWLLAEATIVGDAEAIDLQTRNVGD